MNLLQWILSTPASQNGWEFSLCQLVCLNWNLHHFIVTFLKLPFSVSAAELSPLRAGKPYSSWTFKNVLKNHVEMIYSTGWTKEISILMHKSANKKVTYRVIGRKGFLPSLKWKCVWNNALLTLWSNVKKFYSIYYPWLWKIFVHALRWLITKLAYKILGMNMYCGSGQWWSVILMK